MKSALLALLLLNVPPGQTYFSVEPAPISMAHAGAAEYPSGYQAQWSSHYGTWVMQETEATATRRYTAIAGALVDEARALLCADEEPGCEPYRGEASWRYPQPWTLEELVVLTTTTAIYESGFREDVQVGRGRSGEPSDDRGEGRGPSNEACFLQIHPVIGWRFADAGAELRSAAEQGDAEAREAIMQSLLGREPEAIGHCLRTGMRMLIHSRAHCAWATPKTPWAYATLSLYGTGSTCQGAKGTAERTQTYQRLLRQFRKLQEAEGA